MNPLECCLLVNQLLSNLSEKWLHVGVWNEASDRFLKYVLWNHIFTGVQYMKSCDVRTLLTGVWMIPPLSCRISQMYFSGSTLPSFSNYGMKIIGCNEVIKCVCRIPTWEIPMSIAMYVPVRPSPALYGGVVNTNYTTHEQTTHKQEECHDN